MPTNPTYTKVYDWILSLGLSASEALVYAYILRRVERRKHCDFQLAELADALNLTERGLRKILDRLCAAGLIQTTRLQRGIVINILSSEQSSEHDRNKVPNTDRNKVLKNKVPLRTEQSSEHDRNKVPMTPYIETDIETVREGARARVEAPVSVPSVATESQLPPQPQAPSLPGQPTPVPSVAAPPQPAPQNNSLLSDSDLHRLHAAIMQGWQQHYRDTFGTEYLLTRGSITAEVADLAPAILSLLQAYKQPASAAADFSASSTPSPPSPTTGNSKTGTSASSATNSTTS